MDLNGRDSISTTNSKITSFAEADRALRASMRKNATPAIITGLGLGVATLGRRVTSAIVGYDVDYARGARPMIGRRHATNGAMIALTGFGMVLNVRELIARRGGKPYTVYGRSNAPTSDLVASTLLTPLVSAIAIRELVRGKSTVKGYPISTTNRAFSTISLINVGIGAALAGRELYNRRDQWLPKLQEHAQTVRVMAPVVVSQVKAKATGQEPEPMSMSEEDLDRLFGFAAATGGSVNTDPDGVA